ncbi:hypothetical protein AQUCO_02100055v1 [Aquilegia coerulea]|uniref:DRBM domain-containing protein n=1 Tax=Aquilegia coerulea TaxID=218851 RepID=A0A2G5DEK8_AQUCA|nr:hypothetical protein AQUCO_02100055v1 [Aquilegia coerulea]PIA41947.1 hypothetical protein AQUCO_02100055v1 [Aquilegia coerulea]
MYKNQLQELAQRSCFNLPCYTCIREGPDHAPKFRASVNFNGEIFEGPSYCTTLRQAEHAAAEVALSTLSTRGPSRFLAARVLDEIGVYKNLLQESAHRAGLNLPVYTTERSGPGHLPVYISIVELAGMNFTGESARTKKQAEKNAAMAAWSALKQLSNESCTSQTNKETETSEQQEQEHVVIARMLSHFSPKGENRTLRQREQNQVRKNMSSYYRDKNFGCSSTLLQHQQWKPTATGLLSDFSSIIRSNQQQNPQRGSFISSSKILLPTSSSTDKSNQSLCSFNKGTEVKVRSNYQVRIQDIPPPLEEHQKAEDEWLSKKEPVSEKTVQMDSNNADSKSVFRPKLVYHRPDQSSPSTQSSLIRMLPYGPPPSSNGIHSNTGIAPTSTILPSRMLNSGAYHGYSMAPAVHIRSVIPVCAAPPMRPSSSSSPIAPQKQQDLLSSVPKSSVIKETEQEVPTTSLKLNNLQL